MDKLVETYCDVDDFCELFIEQWQYTRLENGELKRRRDCKLSPAEVMTIIIHFHQSHYLSRFQKLQSALCQSSP
jgi:hypothetical protein